MPVLKYRKTFLAGLRLLLCISMAFGVVYCRTVEPIAPHSPGSVQNPIRLNGFQGQREYLESLHTESGPVNFEFEKTVPGYDNHWLDVYLISPPEPGSELEAALEETPDAVRIYLDGYHPESSARSAPVPPGYFRKPPSQ